MAEVACPTCGNPNLDVDAQNSVVYCRNCGFAVKVDPQTGDVTPLSEGKTGAPPQEYVQPKILFLDPLTFLLGATAAMLLLTLMYNLGSTVFIIAEIVILLIWFMKRH